MLQKRSTYQPLALGDTQNVNEEEWLNWREHGPHYNKPNPNDPLYLERAYGGSDIATIFDLSPWTTSLELFHKKTSVTPKVQKVYGAETKRLGHIYEPAIADAFRFWMEVNEPKEKVDVFNDTRIFRHGEKNSDGSFKYPWALANLDRIVKVNGETGVLEIKRTSPRNIKTIEEWKNGIVPRYYEFQCRYYMAIMNLMFCYICCSWGHTLQEMAVIRIDRDYEVEDAMMQGIAEFDECVEQGIEPDVSMCKPGILTNYYTRLYGIVDDKAPAIEIPEKFRNSVLKALKIEKEIEERKKALAEAEAKKDAVYAELYPLYGTSSYGTLRLDENTVAAITLKSPKKRRQLDEEKLQKEQPVVYQQYVKEVFDTAEFKRKEKKLVLEYQLPEELSDDADKKNTFSIKVINRAANNVV